MEYIIEFLKILIATITLISVLIVSHYIIRFFGKVKPINFFTREKILGLTKSTLYLTTLTFIFIQALVEDGWYWWLAMMIYILITEHIKDRNHETRTKS